jgi:hypothetical protein
MNVFIFGIMTINFFLISAVIFLLFNRNTASNLLSRELGVFLIFITLSILFIIFWNGDFLFSKQIGTLDWKKEIYFLHYLRSSIIEFRQIPLSFITLPKNVAAYPTLKQTLSYWANPEVVTFSPLIILLPLLGSVEFFKIYTYVYMLIGSIGVYVLGKRLKLTPIFIFLLFILTILNPWLMQHIAIGYTPWIQACLAPIIIALLMQQKHLLIELVVAAVLNALIVYGGGLHVFIWLNFAIAIFFLFSFILKTMRDPHAKLKQLTAYFSLTLILIAPKIAAITASFGSWDRSISGGPSSLGDLWGLMTDTQAPLYNFPESYSIYGTNLYDASMVMGYWFVFLIILSVGFVIFRKVRGKHLAKNLDLSLVLLLTSLFFCLLAWQGVWKSVVSVLPILGVEKYPWRFLFVSLFALIGFVILEISGFIQSSNLPYPALGNLLGLLMVLPVIFTIYFRNKTFIDVGISKYDPIPEYTIRYYFRNYLDADIFENEKSTVNKVILNTINKEKYPLDWIDKKYLDEFQIINGIPSIDDDTMPVIINVIDHDKPVIIKPKNYGAIPLTLSSLLLFILAIFYLRRKVYTW